MTHRLLTLALAACATTPAAATPKNAGPGHGPAADEVTAGLRRTHRVYGVPLRVFVMLGDPAPPGTQLERIGRSYDDTLAAFVRTLAAPRTFTLVTDKGACKLSSSREVYLAPYGQHPERAIELDASSCGTEYTGDFAIEGQFAVRASVSRDEAPDPNLAAWIERATGRKPMAGTSPNVYKLPLTSLTSIDAVFAYNDSALLLRRGDQLVARLPGTRLFAELQIADKGFVIVGDAASWQHLRAIAP